MTTQKDITVTLKLDTDYKTYGNSSEQQIDTLAIAVFGNDYNDLLEMNDAYLVESQEYALKEYDYEADFLASINEKTALLLLDDSTGYAEALDEYTETLKDKARGHELDDSHALAKAIEDARDSWESTLRHEWLYGDRSNNGVLDEARKRYGYELQFDYDQNTDTITVTVPASLATDWHEDGDIDTIDADTIGAYLARIIQNDAYNKHQKELARREKARADYQVRRDIQEKQKAREEAERKAKLEKIIGTK